MAHPVCWPTKPEFFPMGINAATSLTQDLAPEQSADILLLGCGDPRHILYTLSTDATCSSTPRKLDITCCDIEPAVLARNIILITLLEDDIPSNHIWDIFYHPKIGEHAFGLISSHSRALADLAETPETWSQSKYGLFIKLVDVSSLLELRRLWTLYADFPNLAADRVDRLQKEHETLSKLVSGRAKTGVNSGASRSAAGMWREAEKPVHDQYAHYWEHGTTATTNKEIKKTTKLNPTFCYSVLGETFAIHPNVFPQGYHFAPVFTPLISDPVGPATNSAMVKAKQQFKAGLIAFQASRKANSIILRFFVGDALSLCRALNLYNTFRNPQTEEFAAPWRATPIDLSEHVASSPSPPDSFDIIDTSTLALELGLLNLLTVCQPLLKKRPSSQAVVYTEIPTPGDDAVDRLRQLLCGSIPKLGILIGLVPRPHVSLFTSTSNTHELVRNRSPLYIERIPWVDPNGGDPYTYTEPSPLVCFEPLDLAQVLCNIYEIMVGFDWIPRSESAKFSLETRKFYSSPHYTRESLVHLFSLVKSRVYLTEGSWEDCALNLMGLVAIHSAKAGLMRQFHELQSHIRLHGFPFINPDRDVEEEAPKSPLFEGWTNVPRVVCVVFIVPHSKLDLLRRNTTMPAPRLVCNATDTSTGQVISFSSIQTVWGKCVPIEGSDDKFSIEEDSEGFRGLSDLIVTFWTNTEPLIFPAMTFSLGLRPTPLVQMQYGSVLGQDLNLYTTANTNKDQVFVLRERPMGKSQTQRPYRHVASPTSGEGSAVVPESDNLQYVIQLEQGKQDRQTDVKIMVAQLQLTSAFEKAQLSKAEDTKCFQIGPCTMKLLYGSSTHVLRFPYPIRGPEHSVEVDRVEHRIDITLPFSKPVTIGGYPFDKFPVVQHTTPSPWNIHHINMQNMPLIDTQPREKLRAWLVEHTSIQLSDRERVIQRSLHATQRRPSEVLVNVKESITVLIQDYVGIREGPHVTFGLTEPTLGYIALVFVVGLRLDLSGATVALDCAIVPMSVEDISGIRIGLEHMDNNTRVMQIRTRPSEVEAWKQLIPAFVERCRTWSHKDNCRYKSAGKIPLSEDFEHDPLCECGRGAGLDGPEWKVPAWQKLLPYATRAAISPLFGVSYLEIVGGPAAGMQDTRRPISYSQPDDVCWKCGGLGRPLLRCTKCQKARYCSKECQRVHWKEEHKHMCSAS